MVCNRRHSEKVEIYVGQNRFQKAKRKTARIFFVYIGSGEKKSVFLPDRRIMLGTMHDTS